MTLQSSYHPDFIRAIKKSGGVGCLPVNADGEELGGVVAVRGGGCGGAGADERVFRERKDGVGGVRGDNVALPPRESDCCLWGGVNCSATTGRVQSLHFSSFAGHSPRETNFLNVSLLLPFQELVELNLDDCGFDGLINHQDFIKLTRLETLSMFNNNFSDLVSLEVFGSLAYLNLMNTNLTITSLKGICEMKNIILLDLSSNAIRGHLPPCIANLTRLQFLDLSYNHMSGNIPSTIGNLSHLFELLLVGNYWSGSFSLYFLANNSKLKYLSLSSMYSDFHVETETQSWFPSFQLSALYLQNCYINKMSNSVIPTFLRHQPELISIDLSHNKIEGMIPDNLGVLNNLRYLDLSFNSFSGKLPKALFAMNNLKYLDLSFNSFSGELPKTLFANKPFVFYLDLSNNLLRGEMSLNLTTLPSLRYLFLSSNKFNRVIEDLPSQSSSQLQAFDISNNLIYSKLSNLVANFSWIQALIVSNNSFVGEISDTLCHLNYLIYLDISHNVLSGSIPTCLRNLSVEFLYMRSCNLSGVIPNGLSKNDTSIDIDLSYNHFSLTALPKWIYSQHNLQILLMAGLQLEGEISRELCGFKYIKIIDLSHNNLNGSIPSCIFKMLYWTTESLYDNRLMTINFSSLFILSGKLLGVEFITKGTSQVFKRANLNLMSALDLSSNKLSGQIPPQIGDSKAIHGLNLSNNRLWGSIPSSISRLKQIESLDLSSNNLSGNIPPEIVRLTFLSTFNVSNNNLSGPIPNDGQFSNFDEQNYGGNELLCGPRLQRLCTTSSSQAATPRDEQEGDNDETLFDRTFFWWSFIVAYVPLFVLVVSVVGMDTRCSRVWFRVVDVACSKLVFVFAKLKFMLGLK